MTDPETGGGQPPPPGWQPPPAGPPSYQATPPAPPSPPPPYQPPGQPPYAGGPGPWVPPPGAPMLGAAHKPGAIPLRPLGLGDLFDGAFRIIRFNPRATVGSALLVSAVAMAIPVVVTAILTVTLDVTLDTAGSGADTGSTIGTIGSFGSLYVGSLLSAFGTILVTGMMARVTAAAAVGRRLSLGQAWAETRGKRWRLIGLALFLGLVMVLMIAVYAAAWVLVVVAAPRTAVIVIWGVLSVPLFLVFLVWFYIRVYYLPVPALMLEPVGVFGALRRAFRLTRRQFWRTFGIALLTGLVVGFAAGLVRVPLSLVGNLLALAAGPHYALLIVVASSSLAQVISGSFVTPFTSAVTSLQYLDQRMRKEAYDVELMQQAGITVS